MLSGKRHDYGQHFEASFLTALTPEKIEALFDKYASEFGSCLSVSEIKEGEPHSVFLKTSQMRLLKVLIGLNPTSQKINALWFKGEAFELGDFNQPAKRVCEMISQGKVKNYESLFSSDFVEAVSAQEMNQVLASIKSEFGDCRDFTLTSDDGVDAQMITHQTEGKKLKIMLNLTREKEKIKIAGLRYLGEHFDVPSYKSESALEEDLAALGGFSSVYLRKLDGEELYQHNASKVHALGSVFKLFVLATLQERINQKRARWDQEIKVQERLKSLPSGRMQKLKEGTKVKLSEVALKMISISDNTATDHLIDFLGRESIEQFMARNGFMKLKTRNTPFLKTMDLFRVRAYFSEADIKRYQRAKRSMRISMLRALESKKPEDLMKALSGWDEPRHIDAIEWFGTPRDICQLYAWFHQKSDQEARKILSVNTPLLEPSELGLSYAGYKGGSEPGVVEMAYWLTSTTGENYCLYVGANNSKEKINEGRFFAITEGAINYLITKYIGVK